MAGRGPAPKEGRRRRNVPARGEWVDLAPLEEPVLPSLPPLDGDEVWAASTVGMWEAWRSDPVSGQWSPADVAFALDTIRLHNLGLPSSMSEIRLRMDSLGLTPKGKRDLRWRIGGVKVEAPAGRLVEPRRLRAVG